jgi:hypothetical protein
MLLFGWLTDLGNEARLLDSEALLGNGSYDAYFGTWLSWVA